MAKIQFRLRSSANKNVSIKIRLSSGRGNDLELSTGFTINPKDWSDKDFPKQTTPENKQLSAKLKKLETFVLENLNNELANGGSIDKVWLEKQINKCFSRVDKTDTDLLVNHIQYIIDNANTRKVKSKIGLSASTIKNYNTFKKLILEYQKHINKKPIRFIEISKKFTDDFTNWLINTKKYTKNYSGKNLEFLKTVCIDAEKNEIIVNPYSKTIQNFRESENERYIQTLSFEELEQIRTAELPTDKLNNARNWILIGCEIGQRGGDLLKITNENIRYNGNKIYIDVLQKKTNKEVTIGVINPNVIDIIENNLPKEVPHQKLNDYVKEACKLAGIDNIVKGTKLNTKTNRKELGFYPKYDLIASHCFRRSFSTNYYKKIPTAILIGITGHSKESMFLTYINKREDKDANADLFMKFYEDLYKDKKPEMKLIKNGTND